MRALVFLAAHLGGQCSFQDKGFSIPDGSSCTSEATCVAGEGQNLMSLLSPLVAYLMIY